MHSVRLEYGLTLEFRTIRKSLILKHIKRANQVLLSLMARRAALYFGR